MFGDWVRLILENWRYSLSCDNRVAFMVAWASFLSLVHSKLRLCSANHRAGYFSNLACDCLSLVWAYSKQKTENGPWYMISTGLGHIWRSPFGCGIFNNNMSKHVQHWTHWGQLICISKLNHLCFKQWLVACSVPRYYLNQCWIIFNWTYQNKLQWNLGWSTITVCENVLENAVCKMRAILSQPQCVKQQITSNLANDQTR